LPWRILGRIVHRSDKSKRAQAVANLRKQLRVAANSAAAISRGSRRGAAAVHAAAPPVPYDECWKRAVDEIGRCVRTAEQLGVIIGIENVWNRFLLSPWRCAPSAKRSAATASKPTLDVRQRQFTVSRRTGFAFSGAKAGRTAPVPMRPAHQGLPAHTLPWRREGEARQVRQVCQSIAKGSAWAGAYAFWTSAKATSRRRLDGRTRQVGFHGYLTAEMLPPYRGVVARTSKALDRFMGKAVRTGELKPFCFGYFFWRSAMMALI